MKVKLFINNVTTAVGKLDSCTVCFEDSLNFLRI